MSDTTDRNELPSSPAGEGLPYTLKCMECGSPKIEIRAVGGIIEEPPHCAVDFQGVGEAPAGEGLPSPGAIDTAFDEYWQCTIEKNGAGIGADYRHWAREGFRAAIASQATLPVAHLRSITHPDWLEVCQHDSEGAFPVFASQAPRREPLTREQILEAVSEVPGVTSTVTYIAIARAIEVAHGIGAPAPQRESEDTREPLSEPELRAEFVRMAKKRGWTPGDFMLGAYAGWLAARGNGSEDTRDAELLKDAYRALHDLLDDTQHSEHNCGDPECPVAFAEGVDERLRVRLARTIGTDSQEAK